MSAVLMGREKKTKGGEKPVEPASSGSIRIKPDLTYAKTLRFQCFSGGGGACKTCAAGGGL